MCIRDSSGGLVTRIQLLIALQHRKPGGLIRNGRLLSMIQLEITIIYVVTSTTVPDNIQISNSSLVTPIS